MSFASERFKLHLQKVYIPFETSAPRTADTNELCNLVLSMVIGVYYMLYATFQRLIVIDLKS